LLPHQQFHSHKLPRGSRPLKDAAVVAKAVAVDKAAVMVRLRLAVTARDAAAMPAADKVVALHRRPHRKPSKW